MSSYCLKCKKKKKGENISPVVSKTSSGRAIILSKYAIRKNKKIKIH